MSISPRSLPGKTSAGNGTGIRVTGDAAVTAQPPWGEDARAPQSIEAIPRCWLTSSPAPEHVWSPLAQPDFAGLPHCQCQARYAAKTGRCRLWRSQPQLEDEAESYGFQNAGETDQKALAKPRWSPACHSKEPARYLRPGHVRRSWRGLPPRSKGCRRG